MGRRNFNNKEIVIYRNKLNRMPLTGLNDVELKLFFAIIARVANQGTNVVEIKDEYLEGVVDPKQHLSRKRLLEQYTSMYHKITQLSAVWGNPDKIHGEQRIFAGWTRDEEKKVTYIQVDETAAMLFNNLDREFTKFELKVYMSLPGIYPKQLFRLLKQWRSTGEYRETMEEWRLLMDVPDSYATKDVTRRVVEPAVKELRKLNDFRDLQYEYIRTGRKVSHIHFFWPPEKRIETVNRKQIEMKSDGSMHKGNSSHRKDGTIVIPLPEYMTKEQPHSDKKASKELIERLKERQRQMKE